jgi:hypothetical protein
LPIAISSVQLLGMERQGSQGVAGKSYDEEFYDITSKVREDEVGDSRTYLSPRPGELRGELRSVVCDDGRDIL